MSVLTDVRPILGFTYRETNYQNTTKQGVAYSSFPLTPTKSFRHKDKKGREIRCKRCIAMSAHTGPPYLISQAVAINFTVGIFIGFYFISVAYANRWLIFADEGWKIRKNIHWHTLAATNITLLLVLIVLALAVNSSIAEAAFVEQENKLSEYEGDPWKGVAQVSLQ
jgi:hypothetical protein